MTVQTVPGRKFADRDVSALMLGTVQFGQPYGVANRTGQPGYRDVVAMIQTAVDGGVNALDTAAAYGSSEEVIGRALAELGLTDQMTVVTKVRPLTSAELANPDVAARAVEESVAESRRRLRMECIPVVLFHREADAIFLPVLERLKRRGWLRHAGVSCDHRPAAAIAFTSRPEVAAMQVPASILDRRHIQGGAFHAAAAAGVALFVRSVYLQGLLLMPEDAIPSPLREVIQVRHELTALAAAAGLGLAELAVRSMLTQHAVTSLITGVETVEQVHDNLDIFRRGPLPEAVMTQLSDIAITLPEQLLTPSLWPAA